MRNFLILPAGGEGSRISSLASDKNIHKSCIEINGKTLIQYAIELWTKEIEFHEIIILAREQYSSLIEEFKKDFYKPFRNKIKISIELEPLGKGGALINSIKNYELEKDDLFIVHNPDDFFFSMPINNIIEFHNDKKANITVVGVESTLSPFTGFEYNLEHQVINSTNNFVIKHPVHCGITLINGEIILQHKISKKEDLRFDFESMWFDNSIKNKELFFYTLRGQHSIKNWFPVNDLKVYQNLLKEFTHHSNSKKYNI